MEPFGVKTIALATALSIFLSLRAYKKKSLTPAGSIAAFSVAFLLVGSGLRGLNLFTFYFVSIKATKFKVRLYGLWAASTIRFQHFVWADVPKLIVNFFDIFFFVCGSISWSCSTERIQSNNRRHHRFAWWEYYPGNQPSLGMLFFGNRSQCDPCYLLRGRACHRLWPCQRCGTVVVAFDVRHHSAPRHVFGRYVSEWTGHSKQIVAEIDHPAMEAGAFRNERRCHFYRLFLECYGRGYHRFFHPPLGFFFGNQERKRRRRVRVRDSHDAVFAHVRFAGFDSRFIVGSDGATVILWSRHENGVPRGRQPTENDGIGGEIFDESVDERTSESSKCSCNNIPRGLGTRTTLFRLATSSVQLVRHREQHTWNVETMVFSNPQQINMNLGFRWHENTKSISTIIFNWNLNIALWVIKITKINYYINCFPTQQIKYKGGRKRRGYSLLN